MYYVTNGVVHLKFRDSFSARPVYWHHGAYDSTSCRACLKEQFITKPVAQLQKLVGHLHLNVCREKSLMNVKVNSCGFRRQIKQSLGGSKTNLHKLVCQTARHTWKSGEPDWPNLYVIDYVFVLVLRMRNNRCKELDHLFDLLLLKFQYLPRRFA